MGNDWTVDPERAHVWSVEYQRNGISGTGFYTVDFTYDGDRLIGVVYPEEPTRTAVLMPSDLSRGFRGADYFGAWLREQAGTLYGPLDKPESEGYDA